MLHDNSFSYSLDLGLRFTKFQMKRMGHQNLYESIVLTRQMNISVSF